MGKHKRPRFRDPAVCACGDHAFVGLTRGHVSLFDASDIDVVKGSNWNLLTGAGGKVYARCLQNGETILLHRAIEAPLEGEVVDHISGDTLDNRRENLRACSQMGNTQNRRKAYGESRFKGVHKVGSKWGFQVFSDGKRLRGSGFETQEEAARAYDVTATHIHGEFACTNASLGLFDEATP